MRFLLVLALLSCSTLPVRLPAQAPAPYCPPKGDWERRPAAAAGFDADKLAAAIAFAEQHATDWPEDFATQEQMFGRLLGPMPKGRAGTNGVIVRRGYLVATFGDVAHADPTYSVAKSMLATLCGIACRDGLVPDLDEPVGKRVPDGGYAGDHNGAITWRHHLQQESEWEGTLWGKCHDFVGKAEFGSGARRPRPLQAPGAFYEYNDVRINRFALSLLWRFRRPLPEVFAQEVMQPIGASTDWQWLPYRDAVVTIDDKPLPSISGGTRWGGGVWIGALDLARFGLLWARGGKWGDRQLLPADYVQAALRPSAHGPDYGFLWWLNTQQKNWPGLPANCFGARGAGNNTVFVSPDHELVIVWRWHSTRDQADAKFFAQVVAAITG